MKYDFNKLKKSNNGVVFMASTLGIFILLSFFAFFLARFSAKKRQYVYKIINRRSPLTIDANRAWCVHKILDITKMKTESLSFLGRHDLNAFRSSHCQSKSSIRTIDDLNIIIKNDNIYIEVVAKSFLHSQVRIMVGTLVDIAKGNLNKSVALLRNIVT